MTNIPKALQGVQYRETTLEALNTEERVIVMRAVPYDVETALAPGLVESFAPKAFARAVKDPPRCKLWLGHSSPDSGTPPAGMADELDDRADGLWITARVSRTQRGDELLTLAQDGVLDEASIEFRPIPPADGGMVISQRGNTTVVRHKRAHLLGVALVPHGAYGRAALVASVRDNRDQARDQAIAHLRALNG